MQSEMSAVLTDALRNLEAVLAVLSYCGNKQLKENHLPVFTDFAFLQASTAAQCIKRAQRIESKRDDDVAELPF